jgi:hypothetical protein
VLEAMPHKKRARLLKNIERWERTPEGRAASLPTPRSLALR